MGLGSRNARRHETVRSQAVRSEDYWDFSPGQRVSTVDGFLGQVVAVEDGPVAGYESYEVELDNGLGGGLYTSSQLRATSDHTGSSPSTAANTASVDYPELAEVLQERKDPGKYPSAGLMMGLASKTALTTAQYYTENELRESGRKALAEVGGKPGLCENGHLTWGGECASCRNTDTGQNAMVTNPNDHKPQNVENVRNAKSASNDTNEHGFGWSSLCEEDPEEEGYCAYHRDYHDEPDPEPEPYCDRCGHEGHDESAHTTVCDRCDDVVDHEGKHVSSEDGECPNPRLSVEEQDERVFNRLDPSKYCNDGCRDGHATDIVRGIGGHHTFHVDEPEVGGSHGTVHPHITGPYDAPATRRPSGYEVRNPDDQHLCHYCRAPLMGSVGDQIDSSVGDPRSEHFLKTNPTGPSKYSALEYGWRMITAARADEDLAFHVTATWNDVRNKARRIRSEGGVHITTSQNGYVIAQVKGDHGTYESVLLRYPGTQKIGQWDCGCKWAQYHWGAPDDFSRFAGRMCSHALALNFEAQSRGMFGREVKPNEGVPRWLNKHLVERISQRRANYLPGSHSPDPNVYGYAYDAAMHCPGCTEKRFGSPEHAEDSEGNPVNPMYSWEQEDPHGEHCSDCGGHIANGWEHDPDSCDYAGSCPTHGEEHTEAHCRSGWNHPHGEHRQNDEISGEDTPEFSEDAFHGPNYSHEDPFGYTVMHYQPRKSFLHTFAALAVAAGETPANVAGLLGTLGAVSSPFGEPAPKPVPGIDPSGPTERRRQENPASAGFLTSSDPDGWDDSQQPQGLGDRVGTLDEAMFEPEMGKEAFLPLLVPAAEALIGAGEAAGAAGAAAGAGEAAGAAGAAAGAGEAAGGAGNLLKVLPKVVKALPGLQQGQQKAHQQVGQDQAGGEVAQRNNEAGMEQSFADPWGKAGVLEDQPEPALPETFGADEPDAGEDLDAVTASTGISTGVEYSVPSDQGQSGGSLAPSTDLKSDPADLEPEDPSFVSTGSTISTGSAGSVADIVARFQHTAGAQALGSGPGTSTRDTQDIAAAASAYLQKEAMAVFTPAQQQELIDEGKDVQAGNLDRLQIEGTHYESLESALADTDDDTDGWLA